MTTDVEESDTEDHERPVPPKRKCIKIVNITTDNGEQSIHKSLEQNSSRNDIDTETLARDTLLYQQYQIDKQCYMGSVDNTINRVMETYILTPPSERAQLRLFREAEMEDRAVMMAIHNHGLVHSAEIAANSCVTNNHWANDNGDNDAINFLNPSNNSSELSSESNDSNSESATLPDIFTTKTFQPFDEKLKHNWTTDKADDGDQQQDILERAVAEAIKIKGLSALSVDYG